MGLPTFARLCWSFRACVPGPVRRQRPPPSSTPPQDLPSRPGAEIADLHCYSIGVGWHAVACRGWPRGLRATGQLAALTDHDEIGGLANHAAAACDLGLPFLTGTERSFGQLRTRTVHIVGLRL